MRPGVGSSHRETGVLGSTRTVAPEDVITQKWRRHTRPKAIRAAVSACKALRWSPTLIEALLEELYVDDNFEELLGKATAEMQPSQYPQALAVALILRHSWHEHDLAFILKRLNLRVRNVEG